VEAAENTGVAGKNDGVDGEQKLTLPASGRILDTLKRLHVLTPHTGFLKVVSRAVRYHPSTPMTHANDLHDLLKDDVAFVMAIVDGGSDWSVKSLITLLFMGRLWRDKNLDGLILTSFCAGLSAFNPIEHFWAVLSRSLSGATLEAIADGDTVAVPLLPASSCTPAERSKKTVEVMDKSLEDLEMGYWKNKTFDGFPIEPTHQACEDPPTPYKDYDAVKGFFSKADKYRHCNMLHRLTKAKTIALKLLRDHGFVTLTLGVRNAVIAVGL
jgi:hypothetical protein